MEDGRATTGRNVGGKRVGDNYYLGLFQSCFPQQAAVCLVRLLSMLCKAAARSERIFALLTPPLPNRKVPF
ncbi:MAG: hypothetical protein DLM52_02505 [Chthoniobacterales bacterium]|nr:MAG: hypothetical protein DLM52_02505 [Chthoniobacterales bacterium]